MNQTGSSSFSNVYADAERAASYAQLDFPATYYLAFRDLPSLLERYVYGRSALDFGCGTGRSTRFLRTLGFDVIGIDVSPAMIALAREIDPDGEYILIADGDLSRFAHNEFDLILAAFTFDNIAGDAHRRALLTALRERLRARGTLVLVDSTPELYLHEWASFSTVMHFPENASAKSGDVVKTIMLDVPDRRPVEDILWFDEDYREAFGRAGLDVLVAHRPLGTPEEPYPWVNETRVSPWVIYVLRPRSLTPHAAD